MWRWRTRHARVVHRLGEAELEHQRLQAALEERLGVEREDVIELVLGFILWRVGRERRLVVSGAIGERREDRIRVGHPRAWTLEKPHGVFPRASSPTPRDASDARFPVAFRF